MAKTSPDLASLAAFAGVLSLLEAALIISGALPPALSYSPGNVLFALARIAVIAYAGWTAGAGLKKAALNGAIVSFAANIVICLATLAGTFWLRVPVLGVSAPDSAALLVVLVVALLANVLLGAVIAAAAALLAGKTRAG